MKKWVTITGMAFIVLTGFAQDVLINEVAYTNDSAVIDWQGDFPDWFELYNAGNVPVNLRGYQVTDDTSKTDYWSIPEYTLNPGAFLILFASDKDTAVNSEFHTSFKISGLKESLYLINSKGHITDRIDPVCVPKNHSRSRSPDGSPNLIVSLPTPGRTNNDAEPVAVHFIPDTLRVSLNSGFYGDPISVSLQNAYSENTVRYTLDGRMPDEKSEIYSGPLNFSDRTPERNRFANIPETTEEPGNYIFKANILRALVFSNGCPASNEVSNTYFINNRMNYTVPVVSLITDEDNLFDEETGIYVHGKYRNFDQHGSDWERPVHVEVFDTLRIQVIDQDAGMRIHGRGSRKSPQKSLRLYADREYGKTFFEYPDFSQKPLLDRFRMLLLRTTGGTLGPLFKEELCNYLVQDMNLDYPAGETAVLFINGEYWGIYNLMERQNRYYVEDNYGISVENMDIVAYDREVIAEEGTLDEYNRLISLVQNSDPSSEGFYAKMEELIDLDNLMDYYSAQLYFANTDWPYSNVELWKISNDTARWRYFFFDSDASMVWLNDDHLTEYNNQINDFQRYPEFCTVLLRTLLNNETFRNRFYSRFYGHLGTTFSTGRVLDAIDRFEKKYAPLVPEHIYRWHSPVDYTKWMENVDWLRTFAIQRPLILSEQMVRNFGNPMDIYPNPAHDRFRIHFIDSPEFARVRVISVKGELLGLWSFTDLQDSVQEINLDLPPGIYIIYAETESKRYTGKLAVQ